MITQSDSTIVARATAAGAAAISIVRLSGNEALAIAQKIWRPNNKITKIKPNIISLGWLYDSTGNTFDQAMMVYMRSPHSYTGEDIVELHLHGSPLITQMVIDMAIANGAVMAQPGEFTKRAFLAGKIDLTQAEAVTELISSNNSRLLKLASQQLAGELSSQIQLIKKQLLHLTAHNAAMLDFSEEDIDTTSITTQQDSIKNMLTITQDILSNHSTLNVLKDGLKVSLVGLPNAGKSTLLNTLLGYDRAIVTSIAGTTRDTITESLVVDGVNIQITDTAGLRTTKNTVEKLGIEKTHQEIKHSDLIFVLIEPGKLEQTLHYLQQIGLNTFINKENTLFVMTKSDLRTKTTQKLPKEYNDYSIVQISTKQQKTIQPVLAYIQSYLNQHHLTDTIHTLTTRQVDLISELDTQLKHIQSLVKQQIPADILVIEYQKAISLCNYLTGEDVTEEVITEVFSNFCIGK